MDGFQMEQENRNSYINNTTENEDNSVKIKCGEIFYSNLSQKLSFLCCLCNMEEFDNFQYLIEHYEICLTKVQLNPCEEILITDDSENNVIEEILHPIRTIIKLSNNQSNIIRTETKKFSTNNNINRAAQISDCSKLIFLNSDLDLTKDYNAIINFDLHNDVPDINIPNIDSSMLSLQLKILENDSVENSIEENNASNSLINKFKLNSKILKFKCENCGKEYVSEHNLKKHMKSHEEFPFQCDFCEKKFKNIFGKKLHEREHVYEKPFKCKFCFRTFKEITGLNRHEKTHIEEKHFQCDMCGIKLISNQSKIRHELTHTNGKPYKCDYCDFRYVNLRGKKLHELKHIDYRPHKCTFCDETFSDNWARKTHERKQHKYEMYLAQKDIAQSC